MTKPSIVVLVAILLISIGQSVDIYVPSMPAMVEALSTSAGLIQGSLAVALISFGVSVLAWGPLSDYFGRRTPILLGVFIFILGSLVCFFSQNIGTLLLGRAIQGCGIGCAGTTPSLPKDVYEGEKLIKAYSSISIAMAVVPVVAPVLGGYLQEWIGWRANFAFLALYASLVVLFIYRKLPETNVHRKQGTFTLVSVSHRYLDLLKSQATWVHLFILIAITAGELTYCVLLPFIAQNILGFTPVGNGWLIVITAAGLAAGGLFSSRYSRLGWEKLLRFGLAIASLGSILMFVFALSKMDSTAALVLPMMLYMVGAGIVYPNVIAALMSAFPRQSGTMSSLLSGFQMLGAGLVIAFVSQSSHKTTLTLASVLIVLTLLAFFAELTLRLRADKN